MKNIIGSIEEEKVYTNKGGRIVCLVCNGISGITVKTTWQKGKQDSKVLFPKRHTTCVLCKSKQTTNNYTGEILKQTINRNAEIWQIERIRQNQEAFA